MLQPSSLAVALNILDVLKGDLADATVDLDKTVRATFSNGTGANQADRFFTDTRTLAGGASEDLDLNGATLKDAFGRDLQLARVKALLVVASSTNPRDVVVGGASANAWVGPFGAAADTSKVVPGGFALWVAPTAAGYPVTAATADVLKVANAAGAGSVSYSVYVLGASA